MATINAAPPQLLTMADLKGKVDPDWCPGCGDFGVLAAVQKALVEPADSQPPGSHWSATSAARRTFPASSAHLRHARRCMGVRCRWPAA